MPIANNYSIDRHTFVNMEIKNQQNIKATQYNVSTDETISK